MKKILATMSASLLLCLLCKDMPCGTNQSFTSTDPQLPVVLIDFPVEIIYYSAETGQMECQIYETDKGEVKELLNTWKNLTADPDLLQVTVEVIQKEQTGENGSSQYLQHCMGQDVLIISLQFLNPSSCLDEKRKLMVTSLIATLQNWWGEKL